MLSDRQTESVSVSYGCTLPLDEILMAPEQFEELLEEKKKENPKRKIPTPDIERK